MKTEIFNNFIQNCHDDCIEIENWRKYKFLSSHIHNNVFLNGLVLIALSPVLNGNIRIDHNLLLQTRQYGMFKSTVFKWDSPPETHIVQNISIDHNTIMATDGTPTHGLWWCRAKRFTNCKASKNFISINGKKRWPFQESDNIYRTLSEKSGDTIPWEFSFTDTLADCGAVKTGDKWKFENVGTEWMREPHAGPLLPNVIRCEDVGRCR